MNRQKSGLNIRYMVELAVTLVLVLVITVVLVRMFVLSRNQSIYARQLTCAVSISQSIAEISSATRDNAEFIDQLEDWEQVTEVSGNGGDISVSIKWDKNDADSAYRAQISRSYDGNADSPVVQCKITVFAEDGEKEVYTLDTGSYRPGGAR